MSAEVIKRTQESLGKYVTKPPLTDKLLGKPPFKYLQDIVSVVVKKHGFLKGLYTEQELSSDNIKDKDAKIAFLQKCIDATSMAVGQELHVRPSKVVAGHETENTNLLLQAIAKAIEQQVDSKKAVEAVLSGKKRVVKSEKDKSSKNEKKPDVEKLKESRKKETVNKTGIKEKATPENKLERKDKKETSNKNDRTEKRESGRSEKSRDSKRSSSSDPKAVEKQKNEDRSKNSSVNSKERTKSTTKSTSDAKRIRTKEEAAISKEDASRTKSETPSRSGKENNPPSKAKPLSSQPQEAKKLASEKSMENNTKIIIEEDGPPSIIQINGETSDGHLVDSGARPGSDQTAQEFSRVKDRLNQNSAIREGGHFNVEHGRGEDSGVGSLESPKHSSKVELLQNTAEERLNVGDKISEEGTNTIDKNLTEPNDRKKSVRSKMSSEKMTASAENEIQGNMLPSSNSDSRPRSVKAYHPDLNDEKFVRNNAQENSVPERPKSGFGIRPRTGRKSARPPSARPAPPRIRDQKVEIDEPQQQIGGIQSATPVSNVILDQVDTKNDQKLDDDDNFTVGAVQPVLLEDEPVEVAKDPEIERSKQELLEGEGKAKGVLVAQILESKKELEDNRKEAFSPETPGHRRVKLDETFHSDPRRRKEKELIQKEVEKLSGSIQALTRSVNPLAKNLDYLQEDLDSMQKELEMWKKENITLKQELKASQSLTDQQLEPLKLQLQEVDAAIFDQIDKNSTLKSQLIRIEEKIQKILAAVSH